MLENELLTKVSAGDEAAFQRLYEMSYGKVFRYLYRMTGSKEMTEDLLVETYTEVWRSAKRFRGEAQVSTWVIGIARNLAMNMFRKKKPELNIDKLSGQIPAGLQEFRDYERTELIKLAIDRLSLKQREVIELVFFKGFKYEDISKIVGVSVNTVKTRVFHAKKELKNILKNMGVEKDDVL